MQQHRRIFLSLCALSILVILCSTLIFSDALAKREQMQSQLSALQTNIATLQRQTTKMIAHINALKQRPEAHDAVVRDELGFIRPDEILLQLSKPKQR